MITCISLSEWAFFGDLGTDEELQKVSVTPVTGRLRIVDFSTLVEPMQRTRVRRPPPEHIEQDKMVHTASAHPKQKRHRSRSISQPRSSRRALSQAPPDPSSVHDSRGDTQLDTLLKLSLKRIYICGSHVSR